MFAFNSIMLYRMPHYVCIARLIKIFNILDLNKEHTHIYIIFKQMQLCIINTSKSIYGTCSFFLLCTCSQKQLLKAYHK